ncbi:gephyrin-like molybdotransferase Glp [Geosporobacter ferrireducens]|uniref:Molybdopterin molybdenumtransferase n=1 Tax=Geosporobacter ferrireducens TaxID=1424294 RepID=A0A1D8GLG7_9FIRM|nr:gephyrin-like molybdotransferase Glp [Geosporobacter ferrireducens]AOT71757.1 molybdopterin molybdenumtransferase MoeA [Geosporobacter ferrireducens]MTI55542.1 molybdopterin molybdotransferase MoeA [Geosporobacter ferrireducens]
MKLLKVDSVEETKRKIDHYFEGIYLEEEYIDIAEALDRIAAEDLYAQLEVPEFSRATVDGYAITAKDSYGASESLPTFLQIIGKVEMGETAAHKVTPGKAIYVPTGGMLPQGADAMVMIEYVESLDDETIAVYKAVAPGEGVIQKGEDIQKGEQILSKGRRLKPQDIGMLAAVGIYQIKVFRKPRVFVISTGDELVHPKEEIKPGQIRDINTYTLSAMALNGGAVLAGQVIVKDDFLRLQDIVKNAIAKSDVVVISGGSSVGAKDVTAQVIDSLGEPGVFIHGVAVKPGKPTIIGRVDRTAVFGLPGHPVSAMVIYKVFVDYILQKLQQFNEVQEIVIQGICDANIHASPGKETYQMVQLEKRDDKYIVKPIYGKSGAISLMAEAHGYIKIHGNQEGIHKGEKVEVILL